MMYQQHASALKRAILSREFLVILIPLLIIDLALIMLHVSVSNSTNLETSEVYNFSLNKEGSLSEIYEYAKTLLCALALFLCFRTTAERFFAVAAAFFVYVTLDNALGIHEQALTLIGLDGYKAEILFFAAIAVITSASMYAYWPRTGAFRSYAIGVVLLIMLIAFFAAGVDVLHAVLPSRINIPNLADILTLVEDGGELVAISLNLTFAVTVALLFRAHEAASLRIR